MAVYFITFFIGAAGCILLDMIDRRWRVRDLAGAQMIFIGSLLFLLSALRHEQVGTDTVLYRSVFNTLGSTSLSDPIPVGFSGYPGYRLLCRTVYLLTGGSYRVMIMIISFITVYGFFRYFYKKSDNCLMTALYFITLYYFFHSLNIHRQYTAMSLFLLAFLAFDEGKKLKCFLLAAAAVSVHSVSAILLIYFILVRIKWTKTMFIMYTAVIAAGRVIYEMFVDIFITLFPRYRLYADYKWIEGRERIFSISTIFLLMVAFCLIFFSDSVMRPLDVSKARCRSRALSQSLWLPMAFVMIDVMLRFVYPASTNSVFPRLRMFFGFFSSLFLPGVIERIDKKWRFWLYLGSNLIFLYTAMVRMLENDAGAYQYRFFWQ